MASVPNFQAVHSIIIFVFVIILPFVSSSDSPVAYTSPSTQKFAKGSDAEALLMWKASLDNQSQSHLSSWNESSHCTWVGIGCNEASGVTNFYLVNIGLREFKFVRSVVGMIKFSMDQDRGKRGSMQRRWQNSQIIVKPQRREEMGMETQSWKRPQQGTLKINIDDSFIKETGRGGMGFVVGDHLGSILSKEAIPITKACSTDMVEAMRFRMALTRLQNLGRNNVISRGDAQKIVRMLQGIEGARSWLIWMSSFMIL